MQQKKKQEDPYTLKVFKEKFSRAAYTGWGYDRTFDDFLTIVIAAHTRNYATGLSHYEDEYLKVIEPYKKRNTLKYFPQLLAILIMYMEKHKDSSSGNDLLGDFYEQELSHGKNGQYFTPFPICMFMTQVIRGEDTKSVNVLDPACGSGRMLLAFGRGSTQSHRYYGIDIDRMCVKMAAINLFFNGLSGEVMCGNALNPHDFRFAYRVSHIPLGIFKIEEKEASQIWRSNHHIRERIIKEGKSPQMTLF